MIVVVDLDGTLCDSAHREHLARAKQWDEFHSRLREDSPHTDVLWLLKMFLSVEEGPEMIGLTGRSERYRLLTLDWLDEHGVMFDDLVMRPDDDWRPDHELKPALLDDWLSANDRTHSDVWFILEDRDKVVEAWRSLGHRCWQTNYGGY